MISNKPKELTGIDKIADKIVKLAGDTADFYHRQPNTLLQSQSLWRQRSLFDLTYNPDDYHKEVTNLSDNWLAKASIKLWQEKPKDKDNYVWVSFVDLGKLLYQDDRLNPEQYKSIKEGLLRIGGNMFPYAKPNSKGTMNFGLMQFLEVSFETNITQVEFDKLDYSKKIGTILLSLPAEGQGLKITKIGIRPNPILAIDMTGEGQGYTNLKNEAIPELRKLLSEAGTKWFDYISQHKTDKGKIRLQTIIKRFGWKDKLKHKGKPECLEQAQAGFRECIDVDQIFNGQIIKGKQEGSYYIPETEMFIFHRTRKWVNKNIKEPKIQPVIPDTFYLKKLKGLIEKNGWTTKTIADKLSVSRPYLSRVLNSKTTAGEALIEKIRDFTG